MAVRPLQLARLLNSVLRFSLELSALYGLARLGQSFAGGVGTRLLWALALPAVMVVLWGAFISPKARIKPPIWLGLALELVIFGAASRGIAAAHGTGSGWSFLVVSTLSSWFNAGTAPRTPAAADPRDRS